MTPPGIYLVNSTGDMTPLATEDDTVGDDDLLRETLREHGPDIAIPAVTPTDDDAEYRLREELVSGTIDGVDYSVTTNIDGAAVFVEFDDGRMTYDVGDMVVEAYKRYDPD